MGRWQTMDERRDSFPPAVGGSSLLVIRLSITTILRESRGTYHYQEETQLQPPFGCVCPDRIRILCGGLPGGNDPGPTAQRNRTGGCQRSGRCVFLYLPHLGYADAPGGGSGGQKRLYRFVLAGGVHCGLAGGRGFGSLGRRVLKRMRRKQQWNWWNI